MTGVTFTIEEVEPPCDRCGKPDAEDIMWSYAWQEWLCLICRSAATEAAHRITLAEQRALDASAKEAS